MSLQSLPEEIILKVAEFLPLDDLISFSHTNSLLFRIFSKADYIWKNHLGNTDKKAFEIGKASEDESGRRSGKEVFFSRPRAERNWRKNNFKVLATYDVPTPSDIDQRLSSRVSYLDFFAHAWYDYSRSVWKVTWIDLAEDDVQIRTGSFRRFTLNSEDEDTVIIYAASKTNLIFLHNDKKYVNDLAIHADGVCLLYAVDISDPNNLEVKWEKITLGNCKLEINVANNKVRYNSYF